MGYNGPQMCSILFVGHTFDFCTESCLFSTRFGSTIKEYEQEDGYASTIAERSYRGNCSLDSRWIVHLLQDLCLKT